MKVQLLLIVTSIIKKNITVLTSKQDLNFISRKTKNMKKGKHILKNIEKLLKSREEISLNLVF
jgi:DNA-binding transcriptional regulator WhiA